MDITGRPEKDIGFHFSNPVWDKPMAEIMKTSKTSQEVFNQLVEFTEAMDLTPIIAHKEQPAYLLNSLLIPWLEGAQQLYADEIATPEDIDKTWIAGGGDHTGPFGVFDGVGLDTLIAVEEGRLQTDPDNAWKDNSWRQVFIDKMKERRDQNLRGMVDGKGFYTYPDPEFKDSEFFENDPKFKEHKHPYKTVTIAGGGVLGSQIAYQVVRAGFKTIQYDISAEALEAAKGRIESYIPLVVEDIDFDPDKAKEAADNIFYSHDLAEVFGETDLVIESVPEIVDIKNNSTTISKHTYQNMLSLLQTVQHYAQVHLWMKLVVQKNMQHYTLPTVFG